MKKILITAFLLISCLYACQKADKMSPPIAEATTGTNGNMTATQKASLVKRGEYLVTIGLCNDCHSPKIITEYGFEPDPSRLLSGHQSSQKVASYDQALLKDWTLFNNDFTAAAGPWGVSFAGNLTSDDTGIGLWEEKQFIRALREGKLKGLENGRPLLPPMPWQNFAKMPDDDLKAIFAYLKSTKPIRNIVPPPIPPTAGNMH